MIKTDKGKQMQSKIFSNPILEYLEREKNSGLRTVNKDQEEESKEDVPKGHYIKRKITHKQTYVIPNQDLNFNPGINMDFNNPPLDPVFEEQNNEDQAKQQFLVNNIKSIISNSQNAPYSNLYTPVVQPYQFTQFMYNPYQNPLLRLNPYNNFANPNPYTQFSDTQYANLQTYKTDSSRNFELFSHSNQKVDNPQIPERLYRPQRIPPVPKPAAFSESNNRRPESYLPYSSEEYGVQYVKLPDVPKSEPRLLGPYQSVQNQNSRQFNWPLANYFPMTIKDPLQTVYTAVTSLVEYGQKEKEDDPCERKAKDIVSVRSGRGISFDEFDLELLKFLEDVMKEVAKDELGEVFKVDDKNEKNEENEELKEEPRLKNQNKTETGECKI